MTDTETRVQQLADGWQTMTTDEMRRVVGGAG